MQISKTTTHTVTFSVEYFEPNKGGMDHGEFSKPVQELSQAIENLQLANLKEPGCDWVIVCHVETKVK